MSSASTGILESLLGQTVDAENFELFNSISVLGKWPYNVRTLSELLRAMRRNECKETTRSRSDRAV